MSTRYNMANLSIIKELCAKKGITISKLAKDLDMSQSSLSMAIKTNSTSIDTLEKVSKYFGVSTGLFFGNKSVSEQILAVLDNAFAKDKQKINEMIDTLIQFGKAITQMGIDDPMVKQKFNQYKLDYANKMSDNNFFRLLVQMNKTDLRKLVECGYISKDVHDFIIGSKLENGGTK